MKQLKSIEQCLASAVQSQLEDLKKIDTKELGEVIDMIKDLEEAMYYCSITEAMEKSAEENELNSMHVNYDKSGMYIKMLCDTINTPITFDDEVKELYITKWLLNVVNIAFNKGQYGSEGILVIQGAQGLGKTRWIKSIIPNEKWVKTGLEIDPSDKDKVYQATKYWVTELGELDET